jgi:hypothetical protein
MRFLQSLFRRRLGQRGQSVVEAVMAVAILGIAAQSTALVVRALAKQNVSNRDRIFATEKALQMLEELRSQVLSNSVNVRVLDAYNDTTAVAGSSATQILYHWTLSTKLGVAFPGGPEDWSAASDPHSANPVRANGYAFVRHVDIIPNTYDPNVRTIYVRIWAAASNPGFNASGNNVSPTPQNATNPPLAEVYGIVHSLGLVVPPSQVLDIYFIALESVPGWWSRTSNLIPLMQSSIVSLQAMNPGLVVRAHWIRTMSYGRDLEYAPEVNAEGNLASNAGAFQETYVYPGYVTYNYPSAVNDYYYLPSWFLGRVVIGGYLPGTSGFPTDDAGNLNYPIADQFNHAMRYNDEANLYTVLKQIADNNNVAEPEISWRMMLEKLNNNDASMQNAIILNLHGEMVPVPPLRNYSDAAKDPEYYYTSNAGSRQALCPGCHYPSMSYRAVTQPENLWYEQDQPVTTANEVNPAVNVYAYDANPSEITSDTPTSNVIDVITLFMPGANTSNLYEVDRIQGNSQTPYYRFISGSAQNPSTPLGGFYTYYPNTYTTVVTDSPTGTTYTATFWADNYTAPGRNLPGLRIQLYGTTPTAWTYYGSEY